MARPIFMVDNESSDNWTKDTILPDQKKNTIRRSSKRMHYSCFKRHGKLVKEKSINEEWKLKQKTNHGWVILTSQLLNSFQLTWGMSCDYNRQCDYPKPQATRSTKNTGCLQNLRKYYWIFLWIFFSKFDFVGWENFVSELLESGCVIHSCIMNHKWRTGLINCLSIG